MPGLNPTARNGILDASTTVWPPDTVSLHTADPGNTNTAAAGELTGGSPAYARKPVTWGAASAGTKASNIAVTFDVPAGVTISHYGYWRGSTYLGGFELRTAGGAITTEVFTNQGTWTFASGALTITV